jgi:hypothetical protein
MTDLYFHNAKSGRKFKVVSLDKEKGEITLKGEYAQFTEKFDKERFKALGYQLIKEEPKEEHEDA